MSQEADIKWEPGAEPPGHALTRLAGLGGLLVLLTVIALLLWPLPPAYRPVWQATLLDLTHVPLFFVMTLAVLPLVGGRTATAVWVCIAVAAAVELSQAAVGRTPTLADFARGVVGILLGVVVIKLARARSSPIGTRRLAALGALTVLSGAWPAWEVQRGVRNAWESFRSFPVIADFEDVDSVRQWHTESARLHRVRADNSEDGWDGRIDFQPARSSGLILFPLVRNWSGYRRLECELSFADRPLELLISIRDGRAVEPPAIRFDWTGSLAPGRHRIQFDLDELASGGQFAPLDLSRVRSFHLLALNVDQPHSLRLHRVRLDDPRKKSRRTTPY